MTVHELIEQLRDLQDPHAEVLTGEGTDGAIWLRVAGIVERQIELSGDNPAFVVPGRTLGIRDRLAPGSLADDYV